MQQHHSAFGMGKHWVTNKNQYVVCSQCPASWIYTKYVANNPHCKYCDTPWPSAPP